MYESRAKVKERDEERQHATESDTPARVWAKARQRSPIPRAGPDLAGNELRRVGGSRARSRRAARRKV